MEWTFTNPVVASGDNNIDAMCIQGKLTSDDQATADLQPYADGGFCCGIKYIGSFSQQPELWAVWFTEEELADWAASTGFSESTSDTENWRDESDSATYTTNWKVYRWLPKEQRSSAFYVNEYRF